MSSPGPGAPAPKIGRAAMVEETLHQMAKRLLALDEDSLVALIPKYRKRMENFDPSQEWEESVIIYFLINGYRVKNAQFNNKIKEYMDNLKKRNPDDGWSVSKPDLRLVK